jgi:enoyl-CoA hydratase/carnithine racemase
MLPSEVPQTLTTPERATPADETSAPVLCDLDGPVAHIVLSRPTKMNAINRQMLVLLREAITAAQADPRVRVIVISGAGRAFSAGGDLEEVAGLVQDSPEFNEFLDFWHDSLLSIERSSVPTIAAVHGFAFAGGFELTQACDFVVIGDRTAISDQHANFGLFPAGGSTQRLPRLVPPRVALWMLMSGATLEPAACVTAGLVNEVVLEDDVLTRANEMAAILATKSRGASSSIKSAVRLARDLPLEEAIAEERPIALRHMASADVQIGLAAFRTRTTPDFTAQA